MVLTGPSALATLVTSVKLPASGAGRRQGWSEFLASMECIPFNGVVLTVLKHVQAIQRGP